MESRLYKSQNNIHVRGQGSNPRSTEKIIIFAPIFVSFFSHLVIYFANVWNEREADNVRKRRDFEDDEVKSHILYMYGFLLLSPSIEELWEREAQCDLVVLAY